MPPVQEKYLFKRNNVKALLFFIESKKFMITIIFKSIWMF